MIQNDKMKPIKIRKWIIFTEFGTQAIPYILDLSKEDVDDDEIAICIEEQVYKVKETKSNKGWGRSYGY